ncbi:GIY-YIG nuclease family protein [Ramlibacter sp. AN1133]|uniref:GIY-YIG nuclease family protein n=1 Tax=Ramlibacter sp. AN1133 TaxID=3133429 RepID=UPI0030C1D9F3
MSDTAAATPYWLYLLECEGGRYYAGIAIDVEQRFVQHVFGLGAKFTRAFPPLRVLAARQFPSKSDALRAEIQLKAMPRSAKVQFFTDNMDAIEVPRSPLRRDGSRVA